MAFEVGPIAQHSRQFRPLSNEDPISGLLKTGGALRIGHPGTVDQGSESSCMQRLRKLASVASGGGAADPARAASRLSPATSEGTNGAVEASSTGLHRHGSATTTPERVSA
jgi:hypothetical protein